MRPLLVIALAAGLCLGLEANAQNERLESVVVTATRIDQDELQKAPHITLRVQADFVIFRATFVNSTLEPLERKQELSATFDALIKAAAKRDDIDLRSGEAGESAPIETVSFDEAYYNRGTNGSFDVVLRIDTVANDNFDAVRGRIEAFLESIPEIGRTQYYSDDEQFLGVSNPAKYRPTLIDAISAEVDTLSKSFSASEIEVSGLAEKTITQPVAALELEVFIPYDIHIMSKRR